MTSSRIAQLIQTGNTHFREGKWDQAIEHYHMALLLEPENTKARYNLGLVFKQKNDLQSALEQFQHLLKIDDTLAAAHFQIGSIQLELGHLSKAKNEFMRIIEQHPDHIESVINLGITCLRLNHFTEAEKIFHHAERLNGADTQVLYNLAVIKNTLQQTDSAVFYYQAVLAINPNHFDSHYNLALLYKAQNKMASAQQHVLKAFALKQDDVNIQFLKSAYFDEPCTHSPEPFVQNLFDDYADHYDQHLTQTLNYRLPSIFFDLFKQFSTVPHPTVLDLGAGTGLCAERFASISNRLIGVDLSEKMLEKCRFKKIYSELHHQSILDFFIQCDEQFDAILAADVLSYIGELDKVFLQIRAHLRENGLILLNIEHQHDSNELFKLMPSAKFSHHPDYIQKCAEQSGLRVIHQENTCIRKQNAQNVFSWVMVLTSTSFLPQ